MKPHPRIRKTIKWGSAAVTVLLVVVWIGSGWWEIRLHISGPLICSAVKGRLWIHDHPAASMLGSELFWRPLGDYRGLFFRGFEWQPRTITKSGSYAIPLWCPIALCAGLTGLAWRLDTLARRRERAHLCPKCGYDRTGLASKDAKCPECGVGGAVPASV